MPWRRFWRRDRRRGIAQAARGFHAVQVARAYQPELEALQMVEHGQVGRVAIGHHDAWVPIIDSATGERFRRG